MEEESEFRDMILKEINNTPFIIAKRAELRAYLYSIIDNNKQIQSQSPVVSNLDDTLKNGSSEPSSNNLNETYDNQKKSGYDRDTALALNLVYELLESLNCKYTSTVLKSEIGKENCVALDKTRTEMATELNLLDTIDAVELERTDSESTRPILLSLIQKHLSNVSHK